MKIIALDIGGTAVKSGLVDNGVLKEHRETPTPAAEGGQAVVALAKKLIAAYLPEGADGIGISTAGVVDSKSGSILFAEDCIRGYTGIQVKALLEDAFSLPTAVENDLNAAAVGEAAFGAGKGCKSLLCVGFGTSVGGAAVLDGRLYTGSHFGAGEFGHMVTHAEGLPCGCGQRGCFERYASASALLRQAQRLDPSLDSGRAIFRRLREPRVKAVVDSWLREIVYGLASLIHLWDPDCLALCGGVMQQSYPVEQLKALVPKSVMPAYRSVSIQAAQLGNQAGLLGAAELARRLDVDAMQRAAEQFVGKHDFLALCAAGSSAAAHGDTVRTITDCHVTRKGDEVDIEVTADGYLYNMVRILAGTLCEVGAGRMQPDAIPGILASRDRSQAGPTLPAKGLFLEKVDYDL